MMIIQWCIDRWSSRLRPRLKHKPLRLFNLWVIRSWQNVCSDRGFPKKLYSYSNCKHNARYVIVNLYVLVSYCNQKISTVVHSNSSMVPPLLQFWSPLQHLAGHRGTGEPCARATCGGDWWVQTCREIGKEPKVGIWWYVMWGTPLISQAWFGQCFCWLVETSSTTEISKGHLRFSALTKTKHAFV